MINVSNYRREKELTTGILESASSFHMKNKAFEGPFLNRTGIKPL